MADLLASLVPILSRVRQDISWKKVGPKTRCERDTPLSKKVLQEHLRGIISRGVCPINENESTVRLAVLDLDSHQGETDWEGMKFVTKKIAEHFESINVFPVAFRSTGGKGVHIFFIWELPQDAYSVRRFFKDQLEDLGFKDGAKGVAAGEIEVFPKQDFVALGDCGSQFILPLSGKSVPLDPLLDFDPVSRDDAVNIEWRESVPVPIVTKKDKPVTTKRTHYDGNLFNLKNALEKLTSETDYNSWVKVGMGLHAETNGSQEGFEVWNEWSEKAGDKYPGHDELFKKWLSFRNDKDKVITAAFIKKHAEEKGWQEDYSVDFEDVSKLEEPVEKIKKNRFRLVRADNYMRRAQPDWIIKGLLPRHSVGMTYGGSGDGKTFAILDMACAVALGVDWNGRKTRRGHVVYICAEGSGGFITRLKAYARRHNISMVDLGDYLTVIPAAPNFLKKVDVEELAEEINEHNKETELVIIDTLAQTSTGADENSAKDMNIALHYIESLRSKTDSAVHLIHHAGKNEDRGARGSSTLKAALDVQFQVSREGERRLFWVAKMKDGRDNFGWNFNLDTEVLGEDDEGDMISSCVVSFEQKMAINKKAVNKKRGRWEELVLQAWENLGSGNVTVDAVMEEIKAITPHDNKEKKDRRREFANRALESLASASVITLRNNRIVTNLDTED